MRRFTAVAALLLAAACGVADDSSITEPKLQRPLVASPSHVPGCATDFTFPQVRVMLLALYLDGSPDENSARGKFDNIEHHFTNGSLATAQNKAQDLAAYTLAARAAGKLLGSQLDTDAVLNALYCLVGIGPYLTGNRFLIYPSDEDQTIITTDGLAGVVIPAGNVTEPTLLTITPLTTPPPLDTKLDIYPFYYDFVITNDGNTGWVNEVIVGVCPPTGLSADVMANLLLGHQDGTTFEILEEADASFLDCSAAGGSGNLVVNGDSTLVAAAVIGSSGVGGSTDDFSPIAPVDSRVVGSSGAGGDADNFRPRGKTPSMNLVSLPTVSCSPTEALVGTEVDPACRPEVTFHTPLGTLLTVEVDWAVENASGGGKISIPGSPSCPSFVDNVTQNTDVNGKSSVCWQLGNTPGTNTVVATANTGLDAPLGVTFVFDDGTPNAGNAGLRFTATGIQLDPVVTANPSGGTYNGSAYTGSGTCSPASLTPVVTYDTQGGQAPVDAGTYTFTVTCGVEGDPIDQYTTQTAQGTITIGQASSTTTVNCPVSVPYNGSAQTPCSATVTGDGGLNTTASVTHTNNTNAGTANANASYGGDANHTISSGSATFTITKLNATATAGSGTMILGGAVPNMPCTVTVLAIDASTVTCTTSPTNTSAGTWPTVPVLSPSSPTNYNISLVNGTLTVTVPVTYVQVACFASPIYSSMPNTKSAQNKGSNLPVKCTLKFPNGSPVTNATGKLHFWDLGTNPVGSTPPVPVTTPGLTIDPAFGPSANGTYSYGLATSNAFFVAGRAYLIRATWSDNSTTVGYFRIK